MMTDTCCRLILDKTEHHFSVKKNNSANFYSFSGGWKISNEKFLHLPKWVSNIKLRGGYGTLGNNTIPQYFFASTVNSFAGYDFKQ